MFFAVQKFTPFLCSVPYKIFDEREGCLQKKFLILMSRRGMHVCPVKKRVTHDVLL